MPRAHIQKFSSAKHVYAHTRALVKIWSWSQTPLHVFELEFRLIRILYYRTTTTYKNELQNSNSNFSTGFELLHMKRARSNRQKCHPISASHSVLHCSFMSIRFFCTVHRSFQVSKGTSASPIKLGFDFYFVQVVSIRKKEIEVPNFQV